jgi:hypothetical protein
MGGSIYTFRDFLVANTADDGRKSLSQQAMQNPGGSIPYKSHHPLIGHAASG